MFVNYNEKISVVQSASARLDNSLCIFIEND